MISFLMWKNGTFGPVLTTTKMLSNANKDLIKGFNSKEVVRGIRVAICDFIRLHFTVVHTPTPEFIYYRYILIFVNVSWLIERRKAQEI